MMENEGEGDTVIKRSWSDLKVIKIKWEFTLKWKLIEGSKIKQRININLNVQTI